MYSSYYDSNNNSKKDQSFQNNARKSTPQYLFLNLIRNFSIAYLILTVLYIPVYMGIGEIHSLYFQQINTNYTNSQKILLQGTIFALKNHQTCFQNVQPSPFVSNNTNIISNQNYKQCYKNRLQFFPFIQNVEEFNIFYFYYFLVLYYFFLIGLLITERMNKKLYIELEYPSLEKRSRLKLQMKKIFHISCQVNLPIYMLKVLLASRIQNILNIEIKSSQTVMIKNIQLCYHQKFYKYAQIYLKMEKFQSQIRVYKDKLKDHTNQEEQKQIIIKIINLKQRIQKLNLEKVQLEIKLQKILRYQSFYHFQHFWIQLQTFQDVLKMKNLIKQQQKLIKNQNNYSNVSFNLKIDQIQQSDLIVGNIQNRQIIYLLSSLNKPSSQQQILQFHPNKNYKYLNSFLRIIKLICGLIVCVILVIIIDIFILIIQKNQLFSYATSLVVLVIQIILKFIIGKLSQLQRHSLYSYEKLSIMLKLTLFIFFNLVIILFVANHNLGQWKFGKILSTYQFSSINQEWYLKIGTQILIIVLIQIVFCNFRVYIQIVKNIVFRFISKRISSFTKFNKIKERIHIWIDDVKKSYKKPIIDLQICYSQIIPIYMLGFSFSYLFPVLYPLLFIFSITIYHTHKNYIELYTERVQFSKSILNDWSYIILYGSFIGGLFLVYLIEEMSQIFLFIGSGFIIFTVIVVKYFIFDMQQKITEKIKILSQKQKQQQIKQKINGEITQRKLIGGIQQKQNENQQKKQVNKFKNKWIKQQIHKKIIQKTLLEIFNSKNQNINEIYSDYYAKYIKILDQQNNFLNKLSERT